MVIRDGKIASCHPVRLEGIAIIRTMRSFDTCCPRGVPMHLVRGHVRHEQHAPAALGSIR